MIFFDEGSGGLVVGLYAFQEKFGGATERGLGAIEVYSDSDYMTSFVVLCSLYLHFADSCGLTYMALDDK